MCEQHGARVRVTKNAEGTRKMFMRRFGPEGDGGIVLSGHTDVVPADGKDWSADPFMLTDRGDDLVARGAADMKGFIAACICRRARMVAGAARRSRSMSRSPSTRKSPASACPADRRSCAMSASPRFAIIGEPTLMRIGEAIAGSAASA